MNRHLLVYLLKEYYYIKEIILLISLMKCFKRVNLVYHYLVVVVSEITNIFFLNIQMMSLDDMSQYYRNNSVNYSAMN